MLESEEEQASAAERLRRAVQDLSEQGAEIRHLLAMNARPPLARLKGALANRFVAFVGAHPLGVLSQYSPRPLRIACTLVGRGAGDPSVTISVVTPCLNQAPYLEAAMDSVLSQWSPAVQYIVQDGGSVDGSVDILRGSDERVEWTTQMDRGQSHAINLGFRRARGDVLAWLNADDFLLPGSLKLVAQFFGDHPDVDAIYGFRVIVDARGREIGRWILPPHDPRALEWGDYVPQETLFFRRRLWEQLDQGVDESLQFAMDWDLLLRFQAAQARVVRLPHFLAAFRVHDKQKTSRLLRSIGRREVSRIRMRLHQRPVAEQEAAWALIPYTRRALVAGRLHRLGLLRC